MCDKELDFGYYQILSLVHLPASNMQDLLIYKPTKMKLKKNVIFLFAILLTVSLSRPLKSQDKQSELIKGKRVSELLKAGDKHKYTV